MGDGIDNDCDGVIDEELCTGDNYGTDTDEDGDTDEDCALTREIAEGLLGARMATSYVLNIG